MNTLPSTLKVVVDLRAAFLGFTGIPQESRLLFQALCTLDGVSVEGLMQHDFLYFVGGLSENKQQKLVSRPASKIATLSKIVVVWSKSCRRESISATTQSFKRSFLCFLYLFRGFFRIKVRKYFYTSDFEDFVFKALFAKTLSYEEFSRFAHIRYQVCALPRDVMYAIGFIYWTLSGKRWLRYPQLDLNCSAVFIAQCPYPAKLKGNTRLVIRYHDAIPMFAPHVLSTPKSEHLAHINALAYNVKNGAYFACISEAVRQSLIKLFPEVEVRSVTIHNMLSSHYYYEDKDDAARVPGLVEDFLSSFLCKEKVMASQKSMIPPISAGKYLLMVGTAEPRKNQSILLQAWRALKESADEDIKLVFVGEYTPVWEKSLLFIEQVKEGFRRGNVFWLERVPADEMRVLYKHAKATICPSLFEGFDFSGVEAMRSGGVVVASDTPVHREIYDVAALYFDPYSVNSLVSELKKLLYSEQSLEIQARLRACGMDVTDRYLPERIIPQWNRLLRLVCS